MKKKTLYPKLNAVIGFPLTHSRSPYLHNPVYEAIGEAAVLLPFSHPDIRKLMSAVRVLPINLTAVTMPFKRSVMPFLDHIDSAAKKVNAVNTIINKNGVLFGYNTDVDGIRYALRGCTLKNKNVLLIGAGGAARAVAYVIKGGGGKILYMNRSAQEALKLKKIFGGRLVTADTLSSSDIDVIINATPVGMYPHVSEMPIPERLLRRGQYVFDVVYNPVETMLIKAAKRKGSRGVSGIDMFVVQGLRQVELWSKRKVITPALVNRLKKMLIKQLV